MSTGKLAVELLPHRPEWARLAADEGARLGAVLGDALVTIHHVGSTAIPGIVAKPTVDLITEVRSLEELDAAMPAIEALGYECLGEYGLPGRRFCRRTDPTTGKRMVHLHCYAVGAPDMPRHLALRDYLRAHPAVAKEYEAEKVRAAALHPDDMLAYNAAKNDWIKRTERVALTWWPPRDR